MAGDEGSGTTIPLCPPSVGPRPPCLDLQQTQLGIGSFPGLPEGRCFPHPHSVLQSPARRGPRPPCLCPKRSLSPYPCLELLREGNRAVCSSGGQGWPLLVSTGHDRKPLGPNTSVPLLFSTDLLNSCLCSLSLVPHQPFTRQPLVAGLPQ